jgi:hypothetical protein
MRRTAVVGGEQRHKRTVVRLSATSEPPRGQRKPADRSSSGTSDRGRSPGSVGVVRGRASELSPLLGGDSVPAATARQAGRQGATGGSAGRDRPIGSAQPHPRSMVVHRISLGWGRDRMGRFTLVAGRRRWSFTAAWASAALRACSLSSARHADAVPHSALKLAPPTRARVARLRLSPLRPGKRTGGSSKSLPRRACPRRSEHTPG